MKKYIREYNIRVNCFRKNSICINYYQLEDLFNIDIQETINRISNIKKTLESLEYKNIKLELEGHEEYYLNISGERLETDKEYAKRLELEKRAEIAKEVNRKRREEKEKEELKRLLKKYGNVQE